MRRGSVALTSRLRKGKLFLLVSVQPMDNRIAHSVIDMEIDSPRSEDSTDHDERQEEQAASPAAETSQHSSFSQPLHNGKFRHIPSIASRKVLRVQRRTEGFT